MPAMQTRTVSVPPGRRFSVMLAPCGFKEGLDAGALIECMARGVLAAAPDAAILRAPMADGGEGFARTLVQLTGGRLQQTEVAGPVGQRLMAEWGFLHGAQSEEAVIEIAAAAGLQHVPRAARDPLRTTSYGVGELIRAALDAGAKRIVVGCGDSGVNDAGAGMAEALGFRLLDRAGKPIGRGGGALERLASIDAAGADPRLAHVAIAVAVNWHNVLLGPRGVARTYGPQKGASPAAVAKLEAGLENFARVVRRDLGPGVAAMPGAGASGGLGAALHAFCGATLHPRFDIISRYVAFDRMLKDCDLVITAEGCIDRTTARGKMPTELARRAKRFGVPVIALAGSIGEGASDAHAAGVDAYFSILDRPASLAEAMESAPTLVAAATEQAVRLARLAFRRNTKRATNTPRPGSAGRRTAPARRGEAGLEACGAP